MILFVDVLALLAEHGWNQNRLVREKIFGMSTIQRLRERAPINTTTIDKICELCECQPGDLMQYVPGKQGR